MNRKSPPIALEARQYEALPVLAANSGRLTGNREVGPSDYYGQTLSGGPGTKADIS